MSAVPEIPEKNKPENLLPTGTTNIKTSHPQTADKTNNTHLQVVSCTTTMQPHSYVAVAKPTKNKSENPQPTSTSNSETTQPQTAGKAKNKVQLNQKRHLRINSKFAEPPPKVAKQTGSPGSVSSTSGSDGSTGSSSEEDTSGYDCESLSGASDDDDVFNVDKTVSKQKLNSADAILPLLPQPSVVPEQTTSGDKRSADSKAPNTA